MGLLRFLGLETPEEVEAELELLRQEALDSADELKHVAERQKAIARRLALLKAQADVLSIDENEFN